MVNCPVGKGIFIWRLDELDLSKLVDDVNNLDWVAIKIIDGIIPYNKKYLNKFLADVKTKVWGWGYTFGRNPQAEADSTAKLVNELPIEGYFIDAEQEYKGTRNIAKKYSETLKSKTNKPLGLCSYRFPILHPDFPYREFLPYCDFHAPQLYWVGDDRINGPEKQLHQSMKSLQQLKNIPISPIGIACGHPYKNKTWYPQKEQLTNFINKCKELNLSYSFWEYKSSVTKDFWNTIK